MSDKFSELSVCFNLLWEIGFSFATSFAFADCVALFAFAETSFLEATSTFLGSFGSTGFSNSLCGSLVIFLLIIAKSSI